MSNSHQTIEQKSVEAFQRLLTHAQTYLEKTEKHTRESLQLALDEAVELELAAQELTRDELSLLAQYAKRDLDRMDAYFQETGEGLASWLSTDLNLLEETIKQQLLKLADTTRVDMERLRERIEAGELVYMSGEFATPGSFICSACQQETTLLIPRRLGQCENCGCDQFRRNTQS